MEFTPLPSVAEINPLHPLNVSVSIEVILSGIAIEIKLVQFKKALEPMDRTL